MRRGGVLQALAVNPERFVSLRAERFDETIDHEIVFEGHAQLAGQTAFECFVHYLQNQHLGDARATVLFDYSERHQTTGPDFRLIIEQFD